VTAIAAPTPNGANRITKPTSLNIVSAPASAMSLTSRAFSPAADTASPNATLNTTTCSTSLRASASNSDVGNMLTKNSPSVLV
jgi:hypothetical protein